MKRNLRLHKKIVASITAVCMIMGMLPFQVNAEEIAKNEQTQEELTQSLLALADQEQYPNGMFEFLAPRIEIEEGTSYVEFAIVRAGNTDQKASVTFKAADVSAKYGEDYTIKEKSILLSHTLAAAKDTQSMTDQMVEKAQSSKVVLGEPQAEELPGGSNCHDASGNAGNQEDVAITSDTSDEATDSSGNATDISENAAEINDNGDQVTENALEASTATGTDLRSAREVLTGQKSDTTLWTEQSNLGTAQESTDEALIAAYNNTYADLPGAECVLEFEPGENIKKLKFCVTDDKVPEDDELAMLVLTDAGTHRCCQLRTF